MRLERELYHWGIKKKHKYIAKVKIGKKWRYFYDQEEYNNYLHGKDKKDSLFDKAAKAVDKITDKVSDTAKNVTKKVSSSFDDLVEKGKKVISNAKDEVVSEIKEHTAVKKGIGYVRNSLEEIEKSYKYLYKIKAKNGEYRYFYSEEEYQAYLNNIEGVPKCDNSNEHFNQEYDYWALFDKDYDNFQHDINSFDKLITKSYESSEDEDMSMVNPFFINEEGNTLQQWSTNCSSCSLAYELRRRGYDVEAGGLVGDAPSLEDNMRLYNLNDSDIGVADFNHERIYTRRAVNLGDKLEKEMISKYGNNTRGNFNVAWSRGGAHSVVWEIKDNNVIIRDCQTNDVYDDLNEYMSYVDYVAYFRTDDKEINLDVDKLYIINRED